MDIPAATVNLESSFLKSNSHTCYIMREYIGTHYIYNTIRLKFSLRFQIFDQIRMCRKCSVGSICMCYPLEHVIIRSSYTAVSESFSSESFTEIALHIDMRSVVFPRT